MPLQLPLDKPAARRVVRAARRARRAEATEDRWRQYGEDLGLGLAHWLDDRPVPQLAAIYEALPTEPPTHGIRAALLGLAVRVIVPVLLPDMDLSWHDLTTGEDLGIDAVGSADLIVLPALAVERTSGLRLGQGGGSYDRALARKRTGTPTVATLFEDELVDEVPAEPHDRAVDAVLTPSAGVTPVGPNV